MANLLRERSLLALIGDEVNIVTIETIEKTITN